MSGKNLQLRHTAVATARTEWNVSLWALTMAFATASILMPVLSNAQTSGSPTADLSQLAIEPATFTGTDRDRALRFWGDSSRYGAGVPSDAATRGLYQVRLTVAGSLWLDAYQKLGQRSLLNGATALAATQGDVPVSPGSLIALPTATRVDNNLSSRSGHRGHRQAVTSVPPTATPAGPNPAWDSWIAAKVASDRYNAKILADSENSALGLRTTASNSIIPPLVPGPCPPDLVAAAGDPPCFAEASAATEYTVRFDDSNFVLRDHVGCQDRYRFYRFEKGVDFGGTPLTHIPSDRMVHLAHMAGLDVTALHVLTSVSGLEGGFDALNTYDTGYVSVGFIQFASLGEGGGSLGGMLLNYKTTNPSAFDRDFRTYGVDVTPSGKLSVLDLETGVELHGPQANARLIEDKRLVAVFARAGQRSDAFIACQLAAAKASFYPASDPVPVTLNGNLVTLKVSDFMRSEAGLATITDLKVNRGNINGLSGVLQQIADKHHAKNANDLALCEREIMVKMRYRRDFSKDATLSQPGGPNLPSQSSDSSSSGRLLPKPGNGPSSGSGQSGIGSGNGSGGSDLGNLGDFGIPIEWLGGK